ncbi:hypothetical protein HY68_11975 [Streptomyces sp. AcH 505]|uniref:hypothetical protein n=1 Tax=unclassified Streptomyces TaxID=2593676 RepID=UPI0005924295|nr:hypothetical protein [Streptomyces sp. NBC_00370]KIF69145.1 hypothetical protein HY68_11975 [Streptomyces sp. AcH 505]
MTRSVAAAQFLADYAPPTDANTILGLLSWCASACGVGGLIIVGMQMALQLRRGEPGEGGAHFRGVFYIVLSCLIATTAGPLVTALGNLTLLGP